MIDKGLKREIGVSTMFSFAVMGAMFTVISVLNVHVNTPPTPVLKTLTWAAGFWFAFACFHAFWVGPAKRERLRDLERRLKALEKGSKP